MSSKPDRTELERLLSSYIDDECSDAERRQVEAALKSDPALRALHEQLRRTVECVRAVGAEPAPSPVRDRILSQLERRALLDGPQTRMADASNHRPWVLLATAAVVLIAAGAGWWIYTGWQSTNSRPVMLADRGTARPESHKGAAAPADNSANAPIPPANTLMEGQGEVVAVEPPAPIEAASPVPAAPPVAAGPEKAAPQAPQEEYREAVAKALVARQVAAQEVAAAQEASDRAAARVAAAQAAAARAAVAKAAAGSQPGYERVEPALRGGAGTSLAFGQPLARGAASPSTAQAALPSAAQAVSPEAAGEKPAEEHWPARRVGVLELQVVVSNTRFEGSSQPEALARPQTARAWHPRTDFNEPVAAAQSSRQATVEAVQQSVQQLGGRLSHMAVSPDSSTVVADVPADKQYLLADQVNSLSSVEDVQLQELAADLMSLEIDSILSRAKVIWYPVPLGALIQPIDQIQSVPVRIVIRVATDPADSSPDP